MPTKKKKVKAEHRGGKRPGAGRPPKGAKARLDWEKAQAARKAGALKKAASRRRR